MLQSGQIEFSTPLENTCETTKDGNVISSQYLSSTMTKTNEEKGQVLLASTPPSHTQYGPSERPASLHSSNDTSLSPSMDVSTQTSLVIPSKEPPLIIRKSNNVRQATKTSSPINMCQSTSQHMNSPECTIKTQRPLRRSSRKLSQTTNLDEHAVPRRETCKVQHTEKLDIGSVSPKKRRKCLPDSQHSQVEVVEKNPTHWTIDEVATFIGSVPRCNYTQVFRDHVSSLVLDKMFLFLHTFYVISQEVDGESLMNLNPEMMVKLMNIKAGPALRIHNRIVELKKQYNI